MQHIRFDDFGVWQGRCPPTLGDFSQEAATQLPTWANQRSDLSKPTVFATTVTFPSATCANIAIQNTANVACGALSLELNVRPSWGKVYGKVPNIVVANQTDQSAGASQDTAYMTVAACPHRCKSFSCAQRHIIAQKSCCKRQCHCLANSDFFSRGPLCVAL